MIQLSNENFRIEIADQQTRPLAVEPLVRAVTLILDDYGYQSAEISIALVDDPSMRQLNREYLQHDYETDVLSFLLDTADDYLAGQLIVSTDTAYRIAAELQIDPADELLLYVVHGTLHLVGLDDTCEESAIEMRAAEKFYLNRLGVRYHWEESDR